MSSEGRNQSYVNKRSRYDTELRLRSGFCCWIKRIFVVRDCPSKTSAAIRGFFPVRTFFWIRGEGFFRCRHPHF